MQSPPGRLRLTDELGLPKTVAPGHTCLRRSPGQDWLVLGLGPDPAGLARSLAGLATPDASGPGGPALRGCGRTHGNAPVGSVSYLECPDFFAQAGEKWRAAIPEEWRRREPCGLFTEANILLHDGALRLFPGFWAPLLAALRLPVAARTDALAPPAALMPEASERLLTRELRQALSQEGYSVESPAMDGLSRRLQESRPQLFLTVNFAGIDPYGETFALLERAQVPVAVWCVDNPFHALSGIKGTFWRKAHIFVTDSWYLEPLRRHGAANVHHLPLAASQDFFQTSTVAPGLEDALLFVGRSAFPGRDDFFAGLAPPQAAMENAQDMLRAGKRPDFGWWSHALGVSSFWPGKQGRLPGLCAEESGRRWRATALEHAARAARLTVCGDGAWRELVGAPFTLMPPVDYYGPLASMYKAAACVLNATSMQLPQGLTQRHFDVWAAGGCLMTDATPGLELFPKQLTQEITFTSPGQIGSRLKRLLRNRENLSEAWHRLIAQEHTYSRRVRRILECLFN